MSIKLSNSNSILPTSITYNRRGGVSNVRMNQIARKYFLDDIAGIPTAAYSVFKVVRSYDGAVVNVRRTVGGTTVQADVYFDSNNTISLDSPITITSGSSSATTLGEFVAASGYTDVDSLGSPQDAFVATWYDQAGSNDATQTTAANQPKIVSSGALVTENGKVALDFDGVSDSLNLSAHANLFNNVGYAHIFNVNRFDTSTANNAILFAATGDNGTNKARVLIFTNADNTIAAGGRRLDTDSPELATSTGTISDGEKYLQSSLFSYVSSDLNLYINGSLDGQNLSFQTDGNTSPTDSQDSQGLDIEIGSLSATNGYFYNGVIQELIIYTSDKSALRTAIEGNINGRFSIYT